MLTVQDVLKKVQNGEYDVHRDQVVTLKKVNKNHVFDEDLSVKRNQELIEQNNEAYDAQCKEYLDKRRELGSQLVQDSVSALAEEHCVSTEHATVIYDYAYRESHSSGMHEVFDTADELFELVQKYNNVKTK
ncbi:hypothetical protein [Rossellomorea marisflavi]|uniref:hypothetical protein n=1 Tax=Rossellomorea marisflavi TaxID=189381 RepID=UPI003FA008FF